MSRIRANLITNQSADGAPTVQNGLQVTGVCTATTFKGDGSQLTGVDSTALKDPDGNVKIQAQASGAVYTGIHTFSAAETHIKNSGSAGLIIGSSNAGGAILTLDGDSNGDGIGSDYSFIQHASDGDLKIVADNPSNNANLKFFNNNAEKAELNSSGDFLVGSPSGQRTKITNNTLGIGTITRTERDNLGVGTAYGTMIFNATDNQLQVYNTENRWERFSTGTVITTGGGIVDNDSTRSGYITHTFNSPGTFTVSGGTIQNIEVLVIGGGGGGGGTRYGAGGGAGGVVFKNNVTASSPHAINVGSGGAAGSGSGAGEDRRGNDGSNSVFSPGTADVLTGKGGGGAGSYDGTRSGRPGASGGGASSGAMNTSGGSATQPGTNSSATDYGNRGGNYGPTPSGYAPCGGGGAGGHGVDTPSQIPGGSNGGIGQQFSLTGVNKYYAGGGGASIYYVPSGTDYVGRGGNGGGGNGGSGQNNTSGSSPNINGVANTGSGGGGAHAPSPSAPYNNSTSGGGSGGSGVVILAYPISNQSGTVETS